MTWTHWVNGLLGIWVVALAFIGFTGAALTWTMVITGIVIAVLGFMMGCDIPLFYAILNVTPFLPKCYTSQIPPSRREFALFNLYKGML
jgi:predicted membrane-bound spermidine synthase